MPSVTNAYKLPEETPPPPRKMGRFRVSREVFRVWPEMAAVLQGVVVLETRYVLALDVIEYTAFCEAFEELPIGTVPPVYECWITAAAETVGTALAVEWRKVEPGLISEVMRPGETLPDWIARIGLDSFP